MKIKITWKAFGDKPEIGRFVSSVEFYFNGFQGQDINTISHENVLNSLYRDTNTYSGLFWNKIEPLLKATRTHTSLSIGDEIEIDGQTYVCADIGWVKVEDAEIKFLSSEDGLGAVFSVREKVK